MPVRTHARATGKRKLTEAEQQESGFRRVFDENDPDNFISQFALQDFIPLPGADWSGYHLANEHMRLQRLQNEVLMRQNDVNLAQNQQLSHHPRALEIKEELGQIGRLMNDLQDKQHTIAMLLNTGHLGNDDRNMLIRTRTSNQEQLYELVRRHAVKTSEMEQLMRDTVIPPRALGQQKPTQQSGQGRFMMELNTGNQALSVATAEMFDAKSSKINPADDVADAFFDFPMAP
jgi:hypothetical protein